MGVPVLSYVCLLGIGNVLSISRDRISASAQIVKIILYFILFFNGLES